MSVGLTELGVRPQQRRAPEPDDRVPVAQQLEELRAGRRGEPLELGCDARALAVPTAQRVEQEIDRPLVADVAERPDRSRCDLRIRIDEHPSDQPLNRGVMRLLEALERSDATPPSPFGAWIPGDPAHQAPRGALAQRRGPDLAMTPLVPHAAENDRERERQPHGQ